MTEQDPSATFHLDQEAAAAEMATRDTQNWEHHLEVHAQNIRHAQAMTARNAAMAKVWSAVAQLLHTSALVLFVVALCWVFGWGPF